jgi:hypothetical protein
MPGSISRNEQSRPEVFTSAENFDYFMNELELVVASGSIVWPGLSMAAAQRRLVILVAALGQTTVRSEDDPPD